MPVIKGYVSFLESIGEKEPAWDIEPLDFNNWGHIATLIKHGDFADNWPELWDYGLNWSRFNRYINNYPQSDRTGSRHATRLRELKGNRRVSFLLQENTEEASVFRNIALAFITYLVAKGDNRLLHTPPIGFLEAIKEAGLGDFRSKWGYFSTISSGSVYTIDEAEDLLSDAAW